MKLSSPGPPLRLVVVALGAPGGVPPWVPPCAERLARRLAVPLRSVPDPTRPAEALAHLVDHEGAWVAGLAVDVGLPLAAGGSWAEALGAWRQPAALVVAAPQLATGMPAAATALLERWRVPLVGLLQWGGPWEAEERRRDGLPWLGVLGTGEEPQEPDPAPATMEAEAEAALPAVLARRWSVLDLPAPV